ncbi:AAA family ATPase [Porphyromonas catoniae]|jgi:putative rloC protein|uniref:AAA domain protein n=1 Tax=Porphyromonas catoniae ATCC 51270 TaxID=887901 RepID=Z4WVG9_9PORP|nr:AAA family ATPase [Porphyromonas catoniae]EWC92787.1 AAA domain protein [Porphyromonas catoniae ATCC 51270]
MIKKIDIPSFGQFKGYKWDKRLKDISFQELNVIYGRNYSGKTTLSRIFASIEQGHIAEEYIKGASFKLTTEEGEISESTFSTTFPYQFRVYNSDFVKRNLAFFYDETKPIESFGIIGEENNEIQRQIDLISKDLDSTQEELNEYSSELKKLKEESKKAGEKGTNKAKEIKENPQLWMAQYGSYDITKLDEEIEKITKENIPELDDAAIIKYKRMVNEEEKSPLQHASLPAGKEQLRRYTELAKTLVTKSVNISKVIEVLQKDADLNKWVETGYHLHQEGHKICKFCMNSIAESRWKELYEHFSKESSDLKSEIEALVDKLRTAKDFPAEFIQKCNITSISFYSSYAEKYAEWEKGWNNIKEEYIQIIECLLSQLEARKRDIFTPLQWKEVDDPSKKIDGCILFLNNLIDEHNIYTQNLDQEKKEAREHLRYNSILQFFNESGYKTTKQRKEKIEEQERKCNDLNEKIRNQEEERSKIQLELKDEKRAIKAINDLLEYFGSKQLRLTSEGKGMSSSRFAIQRSGKTAYNLSDGEKSLIAFCYFMVKIKDELDSRDSKNGKLIIFIDDPISSLDSNHIFYMFSLIETIICHPQKYHQLFISTHNLEFLKYVQRLTEKNKGRCNLSIWREECDNSESRSVIGEMPPLLRDNITEYGFLFREIYRYVKPCGGDRSKCLEKEYTQFYNLPNNMRKFLECYFSYRHPHSQSPLDRENLEWLFGDTPFPAMINRIINEGSHLAWGGRGASLITDTKEAEDASLRILKAIKKKDPEHFDSLCRACGINPQKDGVNLGQTV